VADGWNSFLGAIRTKTLLTQDVREIAISRVAVVNRAWYEWAHHAPLAEQGGVSKEGMEVVKREGALRLVGEGADEKPEALTEKQWAVTCFTDEMTRDVQVRDETFARLRELFSEREVVEIVATVSFFCPFLLLLLIWLGCRMAWLLPSLSWWLIMGKGHSSYCGGVCLVGRVVVVRVSGCDDNSNPSFVFFTTLPLLWWYPCPGKTNDKRLPQRCHCQHQIRTSPLTTLSTQIACYNCVSRFLVALDGRSYNKPFHNIDLTN